MRTALDAGDARGAIKALNEEMDVDSDKKLPKTSAATTRSSCSTREYPTGLVQFDLSKRDFEAADKAIDMLDLAPTRRHDRRIRLQRIVGPIPGAAL
jgi:hypothetical protein